MKTEKTNVLKLVNGTNADKVKIDGADFGRVRELKRALDGEAKRLNKELEDWKEAADAKVQGLHKTMWDEIYKVTGFKQKESLTIDTDNEDMGFYIIKKRDKNAQKDAKGLIEFLTRITE